MTITRHKRRFWRVCDADGALVCVTVFKKGAEEVARRLDGPRELLALAAHTRRHPLTAGGPEETRATKETTKKETTKRGGR